MKTKLLKDLTAVGRNLAKTTPEIMKTNPLIDPFIDSRRYRLSLETTSDFKAEVLKHGKQLGETSIIGTLRAAVRRSAAISRALRSGGEVLVRGKNGSLNPLKLD